MLDIDPVFFPRPEDFNAWLARNHQREEVLWVAYYKRATRIPSITWPESVDEALCYGWIDGHRKSIDAQAYMVRFTPRKPGSTWSKLNLERYQVLESEGRVMPAGRSAWERRKEEGELYSSPRQRAELPPDFIEKLKENAAAWECYQLLSPSVRRESNWYVISAKRAETRENRLQILIDCCLEGKKIPPLRRRGE